MGNIQKNFCPFVGSPRITIVHVDQHAISSFLNLAFWQLKPKHRQASRQYYNRSRQQSLAGSTSGYDSRADSSEESEDCSEPYANDMVSIETIADWTRQILGMIILFNVNVMRG